MILFDTPEFHTRVQEIYEKKGPKIFVLENILAASKVLGEPHKQYKTVHIAGTNGKGSVAQMTYAILAQSHSVGVYTSPHLVSVRERIVVNGVAISEEDFLRLLDTVENCGVDLQFFEIITLIALLYFAEQNVSWAVLEVGLGGRLDATNIVSADVAAITHIALDHQKILGDSVELIAREKAGIIKDGQDVFITKQNDFLASLFEDVCSDRNACVHWCEKSVLETSLFGMHQQWNTGLAIAIAKHIGILDTDISSGLSSVVWPGRMQFLSENILVDGAHNEDGLEKLGTFVKTLHRPIVVLFGSSAGRSDDSLRHLNPVRVYYTKPQLHQGTALETFSGDGERIEDVKEAFVRAKESLQGNELLVITGSLYLVGNIFELLGPEGVL